jgi:ABC-type multidrug transport system fused ATPase/permease subunit
LVGAQAANAGRISASDVVIFMMYALMMRGPIIRLARQGANSGKILAAAHHLLELSSRNDRTYSASAA